MKRWVARLTHPKWAATMALVGAAMPGNRIFQAQPAATGVAAASVIPVAAAISAAVATAEAAGKRAPGFGGAKANELSMQRFVSFVLALCLGASFAITLTSDARAAAPTISAADLAGLSWRLVGPTRAGREI